MAVTPGQTLSHYRLVEKIGEGGMGVVYRAHDTRLERDVAVKVLPTGTLADEAARKRFRNEALALSKLNHPNIETVHDFDTQEGMDFLVMEYLPGETLDAKLASGPLPEKEIARLGAQITEGLTAAHAQDIVHRDLKPGNLVFTLDGRLKILDFGLAKLLPRVGEKSQIETVTNSDATSGTLPYMAPEQLRGETVDARTDIFALGAVLYEMATGKRPFPEDSSPRLIDAILHQTPVTPRAVKASVSPELERVVLKCLEKDPTLRYQSATEIGVDLRRLGTSSGKAVVLPAPPLKRRWRTVSLSAALGMAVLVALLVGFNVGGMRDRLVGGRGPHRIESLAVLPLENLSGDPEQEYFADGMTDALITDLSKIGALKVISRTSAMRYKRKDRPPLPDIAQQLGVDALIEGSVLRVGNSVRITAQLIEAATDQHIWAEYYERDYVDILALQGEVARAIAAEIEVTLTPQEEAGLSGAGPVDPEVHEAYLKGRYFGNKLTNEGHKKSLEYFQRAIDLDSTCALAYAGLADSYIFLGDSLGGELPSGEALAKAKTAALKALEIDDTLPEVHTSLALITWRQHWDWPEAERRFLRAIEINPRYAPARHYYSWYLVAMGRMDEAREQIYLAKELDPLSLWIRMNVAWYLYCDRRYDDAIEELRKMLEMEPTFPWAYQHLGHAYVQKGLHEDAIAAFQEAINLTNHRLEYLPSLGYAFAVAGKRDEALKILDELTKLSKQTFVHPDQIALVHIGLGEKNLAFEWLERASEEGSSYLAYLNIDPLFDSLRSDPRFEDLLRRVGLPPG